MDGKFEPGLLKSKKKKLSRGAEILKRCIEDNITLPELLTTADWETKYFISKNAEELRCTISNFRKMTRDPQPKFKFEDFSDTPQKKAVQDHTFTSEQEGKKAQVLIIQGIESDLGKTQLAKAKFRRPLVVRYIDKLKKLDLGHHDGIVFDDMSFSHWPRESVLSLFDMEEDADVNVKNSMVTIPAGFPRIFTTNRCMWNLSEWQEYDKDTSFLPDTLETGDTALQVRFKLVSVHSKLFNTGV